MGISCFRVQRPAARGSADRNPIAPLAERGQHVPLTAARASRSARRAGAAPAPQRCFSPPPSLPPSASVSTPRSEGWVRRACAGCCATEGDRVGGAGRWGGDWEVCMLRDTHTEETRCGWMALI